MKFFRYKRKHYKQNNFSIHIEISYNKKNAFIRVPFSFLINSKSNNRKSLYFFFI